ncbi:hypothetical protein F5B21DRAFT_519987 [Xylaria acuta]|nr:hypothetical protein F5B21DRAFT_519987 [Xylaria acuta]
MSRPSSEFSFKSHRSMIPVPIRRDSALRNTIAPVPVSLGPQWRKHNALREEDITLTPTECFNVNSRIRKTVDIILPWDYLVQGPGPKRPIRRPCSLGDPALKKKIRAMADDPTHPEFRHTYLNGRVWFFFRILDLEIAKLPLVGDRPSTPRATDTPYRQRLLNESDDGHNKPEDE